MWDAVEVVGFVWTAMILMYAVIAVALIIGRRAFNRIRQALEHEGALNGPAAARVAKIAVITPAFSGRRP